MHYRFGTDRDLDLLARWNQQLIRDEGHRNSKSIGQLRARMKGWLEGEYQAIIFEIDSQPVAYALYKEDAEEIYLRQLFVKNGCRGHGIGRQVVSILHEKIWPSTKRMIVEVLVANEPAVRFWRSVGYTDYSLTLEIIPG